MILVIVIESQISRSTPKTLPKTEAMSYCKAWLRKLTIKVKTMKTVIFALSFFLAWISEVHPQPAFYQGQTIRIVVGVPAGDVYDLWSRLIAAHIGKHIPGRPELIVQNMPGAGSMIAANYVYSVAKPDGLTLGVVLPSLYFEQLLGRKEVQFDWAKYTWIGSPVRAERQMYMRADAPYKSVDDVRKASEAPKCGATGTGSPEYFLPKLMEESLGAKFSIVTGYPGGQDIDLAVERGELHCRAFTIEAFFAREPYHTLAEDQLRSEHHPDAAQTGSSTARYAHDLRAHGPVQNHRGKPAFGHRGSSKRLPRPPDSSESRHTAGSRENSA